MERGGGKWQSSGPPPEGAEQRAPASAAGLGLLEFGEGLIIFLPCFLFFLNRFSSSELF